MADENNSSQSQSALQKASEVIEAVDDLAVTYLFIVRPGDDIAGGVFMCLLITTGSLAVAAVAARLERRWAHLYETQTRE